MIAEWTFLFSMLSAALVASSNDQVAGSRDCAQLLRHLADTSTAIKSISVTYRSGDMSVRDKSLPVGSHLRREMAAMRPGFYRHWSFHPHDKLTWESDPLQQRLFISDSHWFNVNPVKNIFASDTIQLEDELPGSAPREFLWFATGIWPLDRPCPELQGSRVYLHELPAFVASFEMYGEEVLEGIDCWVMGRPNVDRLWIDKSRPSALIAREFYNAKSGQLMQKFVLLDHQEFDRGIWFPRRIRNLVVTGDDADGRPLLRETMIRIESLRINEELADQFKWEPAAGALDVTNPNQPRQALEGGIEVLDSYKQYANQVTKPSGGSNWFETILPLISFFVGCVLGYQFWPVYHTASRR